MSKFKFEHMPFGKVALAMYTPLKNPSNKDKKKKTFRNFWTQCHILGVQCKFPTKELVRNTIKKHFFICLIGIYPIIGVV